jgi:CheY-like chemotaxis protein
MQEKSTNPSKGSNAAKSILVVEDDQFLRDLIVKKLEEEGLNIIQAVDGEEGLQFIKENKPALVLLDLILPGIDGFEVLKQAKSDPETKDIPIIILSNLGQKDDIERGLELGARDFMVKAHFTPEEIVKKAKEVLG